MSIQKHEYSKSCYNYRHIKNDERSSHGENFVVMGTKGHHRALCCNGCLLCVFLAGCAENSEEAVRNVVTTELDAVKNSDTETIEAIAGDSSEFQALSTYGISATDAYEAVFNGFDYKIESVKVDGDKAVVGVKLTAKDLTKFQSALVEAAQNLAKDSSFTSMTTQEMNQAIGKLVLDTIKDLPTTETDTVELDVVKKDGKWQLSNSAGVALQEALFPSSVMNSMGN